MNYEDDPAYQQLLGERQIIRKRSRMKLKAWKDKYKSYKSKLSTAGEPGLAMVQSDIKKTASEKSIKEIQDAIAKMWAKKKLGTK